MKLERRKSKADIPSMAMGDIAFNLLIFFVILARAQDDSHVKWTPAKARNPEPAKKSQASVAIDNNRNIYLDGKPIGAAQLASRIEEALKGLPGEERIVLLKSDKDATAAEFVPVIEAISEAGGVVYHIVDEEKK
jgi:biopolymer transport protein ExbD